MKVGVLGVGCLLAVLVVAVVQVLNLGEVMDEAALYTAGRAEGLLAAYAVAVVIIVVAAAVLPDRRLWILVAIASTLAAGAVAVTLPFSGELWSFVWAVLIMSACWQAGRWILDAAGAHLLARLPAVSWLAGVGAIGIVLLLIGRAGLLSWWTAGLPILALGILGVVGLSRALGTDGAGRAWSAMTTTRLAAASAAVCLLAAALASIYAAAPELQFDALYYKAWLPGEWARTGEIEVETLILHPYLNFWGFSQLLATPGHVAGAEGVGRYMQWLAAGALVATVWWAGRRSAWAPLAAAAIVVTPLLFWQATTAYEDAILALAGVAMALAVIVSLREPEPSPLISGAVIGGLSGVLIVLKFHLAPLALGLLLGWLLMRQRRSWITAVASAAAAGLLVAGPFLTIRWIDVDSPVLPLYNDIFHSPYWPDGGGGGGAGSGDSTGFGPVAVLWDTVANTPELDWPVGAFGLLSLAVVIALAVGWRRDRSAPGLPALWLGVLIATVAWYREAQNPRYALPFSAVAVLMLVLASGARPPNRALQGAGLAALAVTAVLLWPTTVSQFWNVPGEGLPWRAAVGKIDDRDYEEAAARERNVLAAFNKAAPPGALAVAEASQRVWLSEGRDLTPYWELYDRLRLDGSLPEGPEETLAAVRAAGVSYVISDVRGTFGEFWGIGFLGEMVRAYGRRVETVGSVELYALPPSGPG